MPQSEYLGLILGVAVARSILLPGERVRLETRTELVCKQLRKEWRTVDPVLMRLASHLWSEVAGP